MILTDEKLQQYLSTLSDGEKDSFMKFLKKAELLCELSEDSKQKLENLRLERKNILTDMNKIASEMNAEKINE